jgi:transposase
LLDQLELPLADGEENADRAETAAQMTAEKIAVPSFERCKPARRPPQERIVYPVPATYPWYGDSRLRKISKAVTETLELVPRQWKVIQQVRERLVCWPAKRSPSRLPLAPDFARARPQTASPVLFAKYGLHLRLNRQSDVYQREASSLTYRRSRTG